MGGDSEKIPTPRAAWAQQPQEEVGMPQLILPIFPKGVAHITGDLAVACEGERVAYFHGVLPVFTHERPRRRI